MEGKLSGSGVWEFEERCVNGREWRVSEWRLCGTVEQTGWSSDSGSERPRVKL